MSDCYIPRTEEKRIEENFDPVKCEELNCPYYSFIGYTSPVTTRHACSKYEFAKDYPLKLSKKEPFLRLLLQLHGKVYTIEKLIDSSLKRIKRELRKRGRSLDGKKSEVVYRLKRWALLDAPYWLKSLSGKELRIYSNFLRWLLNPNLFSYWFPMEEEELKIYFNLYFSNRTILEYKKKNKTYLFLPVKFRDEESKNLFKECLEKLSRRIDPFGIKIGEYKAGKTTILTMHGKKNLRILSDLFNLDWKEKLEGRESLRRKELERTILSSLNEKEWFSIREIAERSGMEYDQSIRCKIQITLKRLNEKGMVERLMRIGAPALYRLRAKPKKGSA